MSRCEVQVPPAIRSNYGSDHLLTGRAEGAVLCVTARNRLHLICGPRGRAGPTATLRDEAAELSTGDSTPRRHGAPTLFCFLQQGRNRLMGQEQSEEAPSARFSKKHQSEPITGGAFICQGTRQDLKRAERSGDGPPGSEHTDTDTGEDLVSTPGAVWEHRRLH